MFSSLASFLPTALRDAQKAGSFTPDDDEEQRPRGSQPPEEVAEDPQPEALRKRKKERERRHANEVFISLESR